jgi:DNA-binding NarL/FixJ family response regulator
MPYTHGKSIIRIAFADDDLTLQDLLPAYIDNLENCKVVIQAYNGKDLLEKLNRKPDIDLVIMDIKMPEMNGIEAAKSIKEDFPEIKILFSSIFGNELTYCMLAGIGADGFIRKGASVAELRNGIFALMKTGAYFPGFPVSLRKRLNGHKKVKKNSLVSDEEIAFLKLICTDLTYTAIAAEMKTSIRHIDYMRQGLFEKFEVHNRVELALFAYDGGICD